ncbi:hypothetical protein BcepSauron_187 [Burkholderia phage BcepSauron]|uniref:Uncharacterized protein n=2 Tax=Sarumanvirus TaxID=2843450 RepID=A0A482MKL1_9CAUD|nr:hypothetical protein H1O16_gp189 [Burkholderia phage BcepSaruman]YP_009904565.1 hypothetical protein H1O17_gp187 [Burkholderia phage BcepSauron]QBQ74567.1 hypothetical protein BcepSauron_187 [Burkholderia phage BcepSauron]QBX06602.1 hypothetical protein BcepSaruman_189 [Burkholderia phage BcepSaruman]
MEEKQEIGTYCAMIDKQLVTSVCPLPAGTGCMWKHRETGRCAYDPSFSDDTELTMNDYALLVGLPTVSEELQPIVIRVVTERLKKEITE